MIHTEDSVVLPYGREFDLLTTDPNVVFKVKFNHSRHHIFGKVSQLSESGVRATLVPSDSEDVRLTCWTDDLWLKKDWDEAERQANKL